MRTTSRRTCVSVGLMAAAVLGAAVVPVSAAPAPKLLTPQTAEPSKTVRVEFLNTPWRKVFHWLTEETGKPVILVHTPPGTFTYIGPPNKEYTISEVVDLINDGLVNQVQTEAHILLQRRHSFTLVPVDEDLDPTRPPRFRLEDLPTYGQYERVSLALPLGRLEADVILPYVKPMLSPKGTVFRPGGPCSNQLIFTDRAGNLRDIVKWIESANGSKW
jgi:hypothetical protein